MQMTPFPANLLKQVLPDQGQTLLLQACLKTPEKASEAWKLWLALTKDPLLSLKNRLNGSRELLPLLYILFKKNNLIIDEKLRPYLKTAYFHEEMRSRTYFRILARILQALNQARVQHLLLKGASLVDDVYDERALRHCHGIDLLFQSSTDGITGAEVLLSLGDFVSAGVNRRGALPLTLRHASGLPVVIHGCLVNPSFPEAEAWQRSTGKRVANVPTRTLTAADNLVHILSDIPGCRAKGRINWVCDMLCLIQKKNVDWEVLFDLVFRCRMVLQAYVICHYLENQLELDMDAVFKDRLQRFLSSFPAAHRHAALEWIGVGSGFSTRQALQQCSNMTERTQVLGSSLMNKTSRFLMTM